MRTVQARQSARRNNTDSRALPSATVGFQAKGDRQPGEWIPPYAGALCRYIEEWVAVKTRWALSIDPDEKTALEQYAEGCTDTPITVTLANPTTTDQPAAAGQQTPFDRPDSDNGSPVPLYTEEVDGLEVRRSRGSPDVLILEYGP
ncbi:hypothetical protein ACPPVO_43395 [Dactylosporangium sp. McL0621]|uniref:hypothetical protein n=1 Tax=Dactylosporangium sp. McL0621 TaxID=3415678 RepID=UPI003CE959FB